MQDLDDLNQIKKLDKSNVLGSVEALPKQCQHAWEDINKVEVSDDYQNVDNLVMTGMGGSGLGARVIESIFSSQLRIPLIRVNDYDLPGFVNEKSLVICSSYSGSTEEVVANAQQAIAKKAKWMAIGKGKDLIELAQKHQVPYYQINPIHNPSQQPRMAIGYSVIAQLGLVSKAKLIQLSHEEIEEIVKTMEEVQEKIKVDIPEKENPAKQLAKKMLNKIIVYAASRHLTGAIHTVKNQLNENAKTFATRFDIPELNHHLMEGLKHPKANQQNLFFFLVQSELYPKRIQQRVNLTQDVIEQNKVEVFVWQAKSQKKLTQAFELIQFGAYVNFYLTMLYGINPAPIPWVNYFKEKLNKS